MLLNDSLQTFTGFTLSFTGEQWRDGSVEAADALSFSYSPDAANIRNGTFTGVSQLDFTAPKQTSGGVDVVLDGNLAENRRSFTATVSGINWAPGTKLVLRWSDVNGRGNDDGLAVDDLSFSAHGIGAAGEVVAAPLPSVAVAAVPLLAGLACCRPGRTRLS